MKDSMTGSRHELGVVGYMVSIIVSVIFWMYLRELGKREDTRNEKPTVSDLIEMIREDPE